MNKLDQIINDINNEAVPQDRMERAADRVRLNLFAQTKTVPERIRTCADFQALIPGYLNKSLSAGRVLLLQDHTRECVTCRHAVDQARSGNVRTLERPRTAPSQTIPKWWAIAAMAVLTVGAGSLVVWQMLPGSTGRTTVETVSGILHAVSDNSSTPIFGGREIPQGQRIRTAKESKALIRLDDGSVVELNERSEVHFGQASNGPVIHLDRGEIIVQAAKQRKGTLNVVTADANVSVKGTIFAVARGVRGSRVTVVEGAVQVDQASQTQMLKPGDQVATDPSAARTSPAEAVAWSRDSAKYLALLGEFSAIKKGLEQMPGPGLRYSSKLLAMVPRDTILYAAIPNLGPTLTEAQRLFKQRVQESEVLRAWWEQQKDGDRLDDMIHKIRAFSDYLGDEIVFTMTGDWQGRYSAPLILAEVKRPGLDAFLNSEFRAMILKNGGGERNMPQMVSLDRPSGDAEFRGERRQRAASGGERMMFGIRDNVLAIGWTQEQMDQVAGRMSQGPRTEFSGLLGRAKEAYDRGAAYLLCVNMEHIANHSVKKERATRRETNTGFESMRYLVVERKDVNGRTENQATLAFQGHRSGMAGWLAEPAPMGSLDFVSPNATFVVSAVLKSPESMIRDLLGTLAKDDPTFQEKLDRIYQETGVRVSPGLGEPLGGEITFAVDGPLLPLPSWKLAVEVYSPDRLQHNLRQIVEAVNRDPKCPECKINLTEEQSGGRTYYTLSTNKFAYEIHYVYADGYLLAAPSRSLLTRAMQNRETGMVLSRSEGFRSQLPQDGRMNFSALIYHNIGSALAPYADTLGSMGSTQEQKDSIRTLLANSKPGLIYAYGENEAIRIATAGTFFGFDIDSFALPALIGRGMQVPKGATKQ
jgi:hypothetical protein